MVDIQNNQVHTPHGFVRLSPQETEMLYMLAQHYPNAVNHAKLMQGLWGWGDWPDTARKIEDVVVCRVRKKLRGSGLAIESIKGLGFRLMIDLESAGAA